jgi:hypothetical protein
MPASLRSCRIPSKNASPSCGRKYHKSAKRTVCTWGAARGCPAPWGITSVGFRDCRKSRKSWRHLPTGKNFEHGVTAELMLLVRFASGVEQASYAAKCSPGGYQLFLRTVPGQAPSWIVAGHLHNGRDDEVGIGHRWGRPGNG